MKIENVMYRYNNATAIEQVVLKNICCEIAEGKITAIIGKSGSGKTTLFNLIAGILEPQEGAVYIDNNDLFKLNSKNRLKFRQKNIGYIFQDFKLIEVLTVIENIKFLGSMFKIELDEEHLVYLLDVLDLKAEVAKYPSELSGGQKQRVAIARALSIKPKLLLCDEPTGNLDEENADAVWSLISKMVKDLNQTAVLITHDYELAEKCDCILELKQGEMKTVNK